MVRRGGGKRLTRGGGPVQASSTSNAGTKPKRAVLKNGDYNITHVNISKKLWRYIQDIFSTLVDTEWWITLLVFFSVFCISWLAFAAIWYLISYIHGDLDPHDNTWTPCVDKISLNDTFASCFLFSVENQHTIGFGGRATTEECPQAIILMCIQSIIGVLLQAWVVGIVSTKVSRGKQRTRTLLFSKNAVIVKDGELSCLKFRVGDMRENSHLIGASVRALFLDYDAFSDGKKRTPILELKVKPEKYDSDGVFLMWPTVIVHVIEDTSPLRKLSHESMTTKLFEIVVILEGTTESTGQIIQARTSYVASDIIWGGEFRSLPFTFNERNGKYQVDFHSFHVVDLD